MHTINKPRSYRLFWFIFLLTFSIKSVFFSGSAFSIWSFMFVRFCHSVEESESMKVWKSLASWTSRKMKIESLKLSVKTSSGRPRFRQEESLFSFYNKSLRKRAFTARHLKFRLILIYIEMGADAIRAGTSSKDLSNYIKISKSSLRTKIG